LKAQISLETLLSFLAVISFVILFLNSVGISKHLKIVETTRCKNEIERNVLLLDSAALLCSNCEIKLNVNFSNETVNCGNFSKKTRMKVNKVFGELNVG